LDSLKDLADLIHQRNEIEMRIGDILGRPVHPGHFGEYVASRIFNIQLHTNASHKRSDGLFTSGPLLGKSVNIKFYTRGMDFWISWPAMIRCSMLTTIWC